MAVKRVDEVLDKALPSDTAVVPRYDVVLPNGTKVAENAELVLKNPVLTPGMPINKQAMDECLSASGVAEGTKKNLTLDQPGFALFDGAVIRFRLFDQMSGATTMNVNNTGARRLKNALGEDPDGFAQGTWVDAVYSATRDQYIIMGGGGGNAALSQSVNLLEEVVDMKYCKVITNTGNTVDVNAAWLAQGALKGICETDNYMWYARIRSNSKNLEFRRMHKETGESEEFSYTLDYYFTQNVQISNNTSYYAYITSCKMQLVPVRNADAIMFFAHTGAVQSSNRQYKYLGAVLGMVYPDKYVFIKSQIGGTPSAGYGGYGSYMFSNTLNGYFDRSSNRIFVAWPNSLEMDTGGSGYFYSSQGAVCTPCMLSCYNATSHGHVWSYTDGPSYGNYSYGRFIWIIDGSNAVAFTVYRRSQPNSDSYEQSDPYCIKLSFTSTSAPTSYTQVGSNLAYPWGGTSIAGQGPQLGWYIDQENHTVNLIGVGLNTPGNNGSNGTYITVYSYNYSKSTSEYKSYLISSDTSNWTFIACLPGYVTEPVVLMLPYSYEGSTKSINALLYNFITQSSCAFPYISGNSADGTTVHGNTSGTVTFTWDIIGGPCSVSGCVNGDLAKIVDTNGSVLSIDINRVSSEDGAIEWVCPEDGIYKFIAVGGGANGTDATGGGAGYLSIATAQLAAGTIVCCAIGSGGVAVQSSATDVMKLKGKAQATYAYIKGRPQEPIVFALQASGNQGGATGASTPSGGGAGGYDLVQYGGQGMNFCSTGSTTVTVTSSSQTISVGNIALSKDRNGGVSANAGAVTSGDGYGAGGGMNQPGKDGCIVIIR